MSAKDRDRTEGLLAAALGVAQEQRDTWATDAGHYADALTETRRELAQAKDLLTRWRTGRDELVAFIEEHLRGSD